MTVARSTGGYMRVGKSGDTTDTFSHKARQDSVPFSSDTQAQSLVRH